jgi:hypothetical protein
MRSFIAFIFAFAVLPACRAGVQQDFFTTTVQQATRVKIVKVGLDKTDDGAMRQHVLLDSTTKKKIEEVAALIEMVDPQPEKREKNEETWAGSVLSFGVAEYVIEFFHDDRSILEYGMSSSMKFLTPYGPHGAQQIDLLLDYPLSPKSAGRLKSFVGDLKEEPIQRTTDSSGAAPLRV